MLPDIEYPEVFVGLVAPVGVDTSDVIHSISSYFKNSDYDVVNIKVTDTYRTLQKYIPPVVELKATPYFDRIRSYIAYGNQLRSVFSDDGILAVAAVSLIAQTRNHLIKQARRKSNDSVRFQKRVYIISQFKRPEEIDLMRRVYGPLFFQVSVYSRRDTRLAYISKRIAERRQYGDTQDPAELARRLIVQDEDEATDAHGQRVGAVFHDADFIVNAESTTTVAAQVGRFGELLFGSNTTSPTKDEYGLYLAKVAALRTLDLSRQVGAAIFSQAAEIIALGSNEVPKGGGGTYWADDGEIDAREYVSKSDTNDEKKRAAIREMYGLVRAKNFDESEFDAFLLRDDVKSSKMMDVIEYGRIVHAEMNALTDAARHGSATKDATLFCTTFPCHICAKHIVASGIHRVVYLEPYPKSLAQELHADSLSVDGSPRGKYASFPVVRFEHFAGVTPRRYREFFERGKRKDSQGNLQPYVKNTKRPNLRIVQPYYIETENLFIKDGYVSLYSLARKSGGGPIPIGDRGDATVRPV